MFWGGRRDTTGLPAGTHSPFTYSVSSTAPATGAATVFWSSFHFAWASTALAASASAAAAVAWASRLASPARA